MSFARRLRNFFSGNREMDPAKAYDLWAKGYDDQPGNLMLDLDELIFSELMAGVAFEGRIVADMGCGTGRHWKKMLDRKPGRLLGFDVSSAMLEKLNEKFPGSETYILKDYHLPALKNGAADILVSTLTIAHIPDLAAAIKEWNRVLKPGADIIITDYHPDALSRGARRTFRHNDQLMAVKNNIYPLKQIREITRQLGWKEIRFSERIIDDTVKEYYERQNALPVFERFRNMPIIYGIRLKKSNDPA